MAAGLQPYREQARELSEALAKVKGDNPLTGPFLRMAQVQFTALELSTLMSSACAGAPSISAAAAAAAAGPGSALAGGFTMLTRRSLLRRSALLSLAPTVPGFLARTARALSEIQRVPPRGCRSMLTNRRQAPD